MSDSINYTVQKMHIIVSFIIVILLGFALFMPTSWHYSHVGKIDEHRIGTFKLNGNSYNNYIEYVDDVEHAHHVKYFNYKNDEESVPKFIKHAIEYDFCERSGWKDLYEYRWWASSIFFLLLLTIDCLLFVTVDITIDHIIRKKAAKKQ